MVHWHFKKVITSDLITSDGALAQAHFIPVNTRGADMSEDIGMRVKDRP